jgi:hypothetical protein
MSELTKVISVHPFRRTARRRERELQAILDLGQGHNLEGVPIWARGVRVEKAGALSYCVVATSYKGH